MCKYEIKYYDIESGQFEDYKCDRAAVNDNYCIFHDPNYWKYHKDEVREKFYERVQCAIENEEPLYCIGFHVPDFDTNDLKRRGLDKIEFKRPVYFSKASFNTAYFVQTSFNIADFLGAKFKKAYFNGASFNNIANFTNATFKEADFLGAKFKKAYFRGAEFKKAYFVQTSFNIANFSVAKFDTAYFSKASFNTAYFSKASFNTAKFDEASFNNIANFTNATFKEADFGGARFIKRANFSKASFNNIANFTNATFKEADFSYTDFKGEVEFEKTRFNPSKADNIQAETKASSDALNGSQQSKADHIPVKFDYATFRKRARFAGKANSPLSLEWVSLKGVDLTNVEFHNVIWREKKEFLGMIKRQAIIDEEFMSKNKNYEEVSKIYNQLRKNYESRLLFNEASNFFIGEMEAIRKRLWNGSIGDKIRSIPHILYKYIAMYGESYFLPLAFWTPIIIIIFTVLRIKMAAPDLDIYHKFIDSLAAYFQVPRSNQDIDIIERLISAPILGSAFIALRRKFERRK